MHQILSKKLDKFSIPKKCKKSHTLNVRHIRSQVILKCAIEFHPKCISNGLTVLIKHVHNYVHKTQNEWTCHNIHDYTRNNVIVYNRITPNENSKSFRNPLKTLILITLQKHSACLQCQKQSFPRIHLLLSKNKELIIFINLV